MDKSDVSISIYPGIYPGITVEQLGSYTEAVMGLLSIFGAEDTPMDNGVDDPTVGCWKSTPVQILWIMTLRYH